MLRYAPFPWRAALLYVLLGLACWPHPLLGLLHVEAAAVVATASFFIAGFGALGRFRRRARFGRVVAEQEALLLIPWALLTISLLWRPNCGYLQGLLFYVLFPPITAVFAVALAYALTGTRLRRKRLLFVLAGLLLLVGPPLYDLGLHPQFYTYNHIFGGFLGPIYDEELAVRPGLFAFRGLTLLWALLFYLIGRRLRAPRARWRLTGAAAAVALLIGAAYAFSAHLGFNTPAWKIEQTLGGHLRTAHFDLYYDPAALSDEELRRLASDHEYRYAQLAERLGVAVPERVQSYLYPTSEVRAALTGARVTNVAPVWLPAPQTHVLLSAYPYVFAHELAHAFSREFGLPLVHASRSVGLVEGLAEAVEPPSGAPSLDEQVAVGAALGVGLGEGRLGDDLARRLSAAGFWTGRGAVSYTVMGSFVRFLLERYGADRLRRVYAWGDFEKVYGRPVGELAAEWEAHLAAQPLVARATEPLVAQRFAVPSLFEVRCPHHVPAYRRAYRRGVAALAEGDTTAALDHLEAALRRQPTYAAALETWAAVRLAQDAAEDVLQRLSALDPERRTATLCVRLGDAYARRGQVGAAEASYEAALRRLPGYAHDARAYVVLRKALAPAPEIAQILTSGADALAQAEALAAYDAPAARLLRALRLSAADAFVEARALLRGSLPEATPAARAALALRRTVWEARLAEAAGALADAERLSAEASTAYRAAGDLNTSAHLADEAARLRWLRTRGATHRDPR